MGNRNPDVDQWLERYDNPQRELVAKIRVFILECDPAVKEAIKWQAPTFMYKGNIASFFPKAKKNVTLMFHQGHPSRMMPGFWKVTVKSPVWPGSSTTTISRPRRHHFGK